MKIQCDACENAVAAVMCCADEAALCVECDNRVHAANRLANKHQRVPLLAQPKEGGSKCDICQVRALVLMSALGKGGFEVHCSWLSSGGLLKWPGVRGEPIIRRASCCMLHGAFGTCLGSRGYKTFSKICWY